MTEYTIESLEKTFKEHDEIAIKQWKEQLEKYKKDFPDSPVPSHLINDFSLAKALHVICKEINELKDKTSGISKIGGNHLKISGIRIEA